MAKRRALITTFFLLAQIIGITSAQASTIDLTVTVSSLTGTINEAEWGGGLSVGALSGQLTDNAPISGGLVQDSAIFTSDIYSTIAFSGAEYTPGTYSVQCQAVVNYMAHITQDAANPFQNAAWNAYLSWGGGSTSIFQINRNPGDPTDDTITGITTIDFSIPFLTSSMWETDSTFWVTRVGIWQGEDRPVTLTLHLEQSGQSAASAVPVPGTVYLFGSGLLAFVGRKLWFGSGKS